ncbi:MAG: spermine/spermidine synthase domain-containing protein [Pseudobdellovibrionaceae bacterium]
MLTGFLIVILTLSFAFFGILDEYLLAYYTTAVLGGGYSILFLTFSFFAAFLGCGAIGYNFLPQRFRSLFYLGLIQVLLGLAVLVIPKYFEVLNRLYIERGTVFPLVLILSLVPAALMGFVTGFELPFLYSISKSRISKILFWDYLGMFTGIILFPYLLARNIPYAKMMSALGGSVFFIGVILIIFGKSKLVKESSGHESSLQEKEKLRSRRIPLKIGLGVTFLLSFCAFSYQGLVGKVIISILGDSHFVQAYAIGFFIIGMAIGSILIDSIRKLQGEAAPLLVRVEIGICLMAALSPLLLYFMGGTVALFEGTFFQVSEQSFLRAGSIIFSFISLFIGCLTGMELPLIFRWMQLESEDRDAYWLIAANYSAAIFSGLLISFLLPQYLGHSFSFVPVIFVNLLALMMVLSQEVNFKAIQKLGPLVIIGAGVVINLHFVQSSRQFFLDAYYSKFSLTELSLQSLQTTLKAINDLGTTLRIESFFQNIDIRTTEEHNVEGREHNFSLYLNKQPQFNSEIFKNYHQSMSLAGLSFSRSHPEKILILGGGDGLLAGELLHRFPESKIHLVELDPMMIEFARNNSRFAYLNEEALKNPRVQVEVGDAYSFVRRTMQKYDLIFVDFPYPTSVDLSRLYSLEFYKGLHEALSESGVAIIDAPLIVNYLNDQRIGADPIVGKILSTVYYAGFKKPFCFGPFDPFLAVAKDNRSLEFSEEALKAASNPVFVNLKSLLPSLGEVRYDEKLVNRVLAPTILEM